jgi:hypothetical protein
MASRVCAIITGLLLLVIVALLVLLTTPLVI